MDDTAESAAVNTSASTELPEESACSSAEETDLPDATSEPSDTTEAATSATTAEDPDTISFAFITDLHADGAFYRQIVDQLDSVARISRQEQADFICVGGDLTTGVDADKAVVINKLRYFSYILGKANVPVFILKGNHDDNSYYTDTPLTGNILTESDWYASAIQPMRNGEVHDSQDAQSAFYYMDFPEKKVRVVCLDASSYPVIDNGDGTMKYAGYTIWGYGPRQVTWLCEEGLADIPDGYQVLVFSHMPTRASLNNFGYEPKNGALIEGILKACHEGGTFSGSTAGTDWDVSVSADFTAQGARKILAYVAGHIHSDLISKPEDLGWNYIMTSYAYCAEGTLQYAPAGATLPTPRIIGTETEDCWDLITIRVSTGEAYCRRFGAGSDRTA